MKLFKLNILISLSIITLSLCGCGNNSLIPTASQSNDDTRSEITDGWKDVDGSRYYYKDNEKQTGWLKLDNDWYYLGDDGKERTGWIKDKDEKWHYMNDDGTMATNTTVDGKYLNKDGLMEETPGDNKSDNTGEGQKSNAQTTDVSYEVYKNPRYGFSINYPNYYRVKQVPDNGDGIKLYADDGGKITVYGSNNVFNYTVSDYYNQALKSINDPISYKSCSKNKFVISYEEEGFIYYQCTAVGAGAENTFIIKYPVNNKDYYDSIVTNLYNSFSTPDLG